MMQPPSDAVPRMEGLEEQATDSALRRVGRRITTGLLIAIPALVTFWVVELTLVFAVAAGEPLALALAGFVRPFSREASDLIVSDGLRWVVAIALMLGLFYLLGTFARKINGQRLLNWAEAVVLQIPVIETIYGGVKQLITSFRMTNAAGEGAGRRAVLIPFPNPMMKTVGFVTRTFVDAGTGDVYASVYVPTTPNPTSGFVQIVAEKDLVYLDWEMQDAIQFIVSGGTAGPTSMTFNRPLPAKAG